MLNGKTFLRIYNTMKKGIDIKLIVICDVQSLYTISISNVITFNFILKFTTKTLPNKSGVVCKKAYILFVVKKELEWQGKSGINHNITRHILIPYSTYTTRSIPT